jgi:hypothetical protein
VRWGEHKIEREGRIRELLSCVSWDGLVSKKLRRRVDRLRRHRFAEIGLLAEELLQEDDFQRQMSSARRNRESSTLTILNEHYERWLEGRDGRLGPELTLRLD